MEGQTVTSTRLDHTANQLAAEGSGATVPTNQTAGIFSRLIGMTLSTRDLHLEQSFPPGFDQHAREVYFILYQDPQGGIDSISFINITLERILRGLVSQTDRIQREYRGRVRGRVAWAATCKARLSKEYDPTRFVCTEVHRHFDTPENQLLRYMVETIWSLVETIPAIIRQGFYCLTGPAASKSMSVLSTRMRLSGVETRLPRLRRHPQLRQITIPDRITIEHLRCAETSKMEEYGEVARLYRRYHRCLIRRDQQELVDLGHALLPLPGHLDEEGEYWLRVAAMILKSMPLQRGGTFSRI